MTPWIADAKGLHPSPDTVLRYVGMPRMTGLSRSLLEPAAAFIASTRIVSASRGASTGQWSLSCDDGKTFGPFDGLLINTPPQQAIPLLSAAPRRELPPTPGAWRTRTTPHRTTTTQNLRTDVSQTLTHPPANPA